MIVNWLIDFDVIDYFTDAFDWLIGWLIGL